jgi:two-component system chemotaxis sensor kinase CheA
MTGWLQGVAQNPEGVPVLDDILQEIDSITAVLIANAKSSFSLSEVSELRRFTQAELDDIMKVYGWHSSSQKMERPAVQPASEGFVSDVPAHIDQGKGGRTRGSSSSLSERSKKTSRLNDTARVSAQKLDELIQLVELLSVQEERGRATEALPESDAPSFSQSSDAHGKIIKEIQQKVLELRMQPLAGLLQKLEKTALALADAQGKAIRVVVEGGNVQLDKRVIEKLSVPLVHVIRNSVDHGVESVGVRAALGKPREALIKIRAVRDATGVSISVSDDGRGLNNDDILAAAVKKGVVGSGQQLTPEKLTALIFVQGVSTATRLTEVSGRGVGLDVVMHTVQSLGGEVSVSSEPQGGTLITIYLPERQTLSLG